MILYTTIDIFGYISGNDFWSGHPGIDIAAGLGAQVWAASAGTVTIAKEETPEKLTVVQMLATERGARTMTLDPKTHNIYLATARFEAQPEPAPGAPRQRPKAVPGSFKILVYGMSP